MKYEHAGHSGERCFHRSLGEVVKCAFSVPQVHYNAVRGGIPPVRVTENGSEPLSELEMARYDKLRSAAEWAAKD